MEVATSFNKKVNSLLNLKWIFHKISLRAYYSHGLILTSQFDNNMDIYSCVLVDWMDGMPTFVARTEAMLERFLHGANMGLAGRQRPGGSGQYGRRVRNVPYSLTSGYFYVYAHFQLDLLSRQIGVDLSNKRCSFPKGRDCRVQIGDKIKS